ncbi:hypothetical protein BESB_034100 [Besnoitia besnoiti]|uniref:SRS domain-containing protein n=1 Tax=Besnoitia besnoiti TaxID=94643 RepID=A0A2A9MMY6_BESBE|nr:hypothetical protein BESB_034100 [Besnoitia besnoiti]PFH36952.1 hypothetical protein BESB_034100 [Besnoitia besnoiti]
MAAVALRKGVVRFSLLLFLALASVGAEASSSTPKQPRLCGFFLKTLILQLKPNDEVTFQCGRENPGHLKPDAGTANAFTDYKCEGSISPLSTLCPGAVLEPVKAAQGVSKTNTYKLKIPQQGCKTKKWFHQCVLPPSGLRVSAQPTDTKKCIVTVTVSGTTDASDPDGYGETGSAGPDDPSSDGTPPTVCAKGTLEATVSMDSPLSFKCGAGMALEPSDTTKALNKDCKKELVLQDVLSSALLEARPPSQEANADTKYTLSLNSAPAKNAQICYKCASRAPPSASGDHSNVKAERSAPAKECLLKVRATSGTPSNQVWWSVTSFAVFPAVLGIAHSML